MYSLIEAFELVTGSAEFDLVSLEQLKEALGIEGSDENEALQRQITMLSQAICEALGFPRGLGRAEVLETFQFQSCEPPPCGGAIVMSYAAARFGMPVVAVNSITQDEMPLDPASDCDIDLATGAIWRRNGAQWGGRVQAAYSGGLILPDDAPAVLQMAVIKAIEIDRARGAVDPTIRSVTHGEVSITYQNAPTADEGPAAAAVAMVKHLRPVAI